VLSLLRVRVKSKVQQIVNSIVDKNYFLLQKKLNPKADGVNKQITGKCKFYC
jgi:hypothetical protein